MLGTLPPASIRRRKRSLSYPLSAWTSTLVGRWPRSSSPAWQSAAWPPVSASATLPPSLHSRSVGVW